MKKIIVLCILFLLFSCQRESQTVMDNNPEKAITGIPASTGGSLENTGTLVYESGMTETKTLSGSPEISSGSLETQTFSSEKIKSSIIEKTIINEQESDDESITKYVNDKIHYTKINYVPKNLVRIQSDYVYDTKGNQVLREETNEALQQLAKDFYQEFQIKLKVVSAYRSYNYQVGIKKGGCSDLFCAKAGYSEHQSGLAFDMFETTSKDEFLSKLDLKKYYEWMEKNAYKYGFNNSYKNGKEIDGYAIEPWHWRYLGVDFAQELQEKNMSYGAYFQKYGQK